MKTILLLVFLAGCNHSGEWTTALYNYKCTSDQHKKVEYEYNFCINSGYVKTFCLGTAYIRNCDKIKECKE